MLCSVSPLPCVDSHVSESTPVDEHCKFQPPLALGVRQHCQFEDTQEEREQNDQATQVVIEVQERLHRGQTLAQSQH